MERFQRFLFLLLALAVVIPVLLKSRPSVPSRAPAAFFAPSSARGYVRVSGDVRHPGMYPCSANILTGGVIMMAEPVMPISVMEPRGIDAVPVSNGDALHLRFNGSDRAFVVRGTIPAAERLVMGIPLELNEMSEAELDRVPGIGPALAGRIVAYRQKNGGRMAVGDLLRVEGIGEKKFEVLQKYF